MPDRNKRLPTRRACGYGPTGFAAVALADQSGIGALSIASGGLASFVQNGTLLATPLTMAANA